MRPYEQLFEIARQAIAAGVDIIQLRDKHGSAKDCLAWARRFADLVGGNIPLIVNDRVDVAIASGVKGVHLGQDDLSITAAREILGSKGIIGASCQTLEHVLQAERDGADYIGFGSVFKTLTKPERKPMDLNVLRQVVAETDIPVFAIGGIDLKNVSQLTEIGVRRVAVCRAICLAEDIAKTIKVFKERLTD